MQPASRSQPNFICSMSMVGDCLHMPFRKIASELWLLLQLMGPICFLWENACEQSSFFIFCWIFMHIKMTCIKSGMRSKMGQIGSTVAELRPLDCQNGHYIVNSVVSSFFVGSSWNLQIIMTCIKSQTSLKMGQIGPAMAELCPLDCQDCLWTLSRPCFQPNQLQTFSEWYPW